MVIHIRHVFSALSQYRKAVTGHKVTWSRQIKTYLQLMYETYMSFRCFVTSHGVTWSHDLSTKVRSQGLRSHDSKSITGAV